MIIPCWDGIKEIHHHPHHTTINISIHTNY
jgi:hypothetical protein